jgi:hypothetical protein
MEGEQADRDTEDSTESSAERDMVRSGSPGSDSSGTGTDRAAKERLAEPHAPRKLHSCTWKEYSDPWVSRRPGTGRGGEDSRMDRGSCDRKDFRADADESRLVLSEDPSTVMDTDLHGRPPLPEEEVASKVRLSQDPMAVGAETTTIGVSGFAGPRIETDVAVEAFFQRACDGHDEAPFMVMVLVLSGQAALIAATGAKDTGSLGTAQLPPPAAPTATTDLLSDQRHTEAAEQGKENTTPHGKEPCRLPRLVLESNEIVMEEPSSEKTAE